MNDERLANIEIKLAYLERTVSDLDSVLRGLSSDMETMKRELIRLRSLGAQESPPAPASDKPPHY
jgi:uncharacterized coiled-coil protein SlyX